MSNKLLLPSEVSARVRLSPKTIYRLRRKDQFPAPIVLGERRIAWRESDIERWLANCATASLAGHADAE
ncbi:helix-turn-helix transcriptional regulator [Microvirga sp. P5_D2]